MINMDDLFPRRRVPGLKALKPEDMAVVADFGAACAAYMRARPDMVEQEDGGVKYRREAVPEATFAVLKRCFAVGEFAPGRGADIGGWAAALDEWRDADPASFGAMVRSIAPGLSLGRKVEPDRSINEACKALSVAKHERDVKAWRVGRGQDPDRPAIDGPTAEADRPGYPKAVPFGDIVAAVLGAEPLGKVLSGDIASIMGLGFDAGEFASFPPSMRRALLVGWWLIEEFRDDCGECGWD